MSKIKGTFLKINIKKTLLLDKLRTCTKKSYSVSSSHQNIHHLLVNDQNIKLGQAHNAS